MYTRSAGRGHGHHRQRRPDTEETRQGSHSHTHNPFRQCPPRNRSAPLPHNSNRTQSRHHRFHSQLPRGHSRNDPPSNHFRTGSHTQRPAWLLDKRLRELLTSGAVVSRDLEILIRQIEQLQPDPEEMPWEPTFNREILVLRPKATSPFTDPTAYQASTEREAQEQGAEAQGSVVQQPQSQQQPPPQPPPSTSYSAPPSVPAFQHPHLGPISQPASALQNPNPLRPLPRIPTDFGQRPTAVRDPISPGRMPSGFGALRPPFSDHGTHFHWSGSM